MSEPLKTQDMRWNRPLFSHLPISHSALNRERANPYGFPHDLGRKAGANFIPAPQNHLIYVTALACSDRLEQIFAVVPALPLFGEPDEAWRD
jgi:hypothetical protein